MVMVTRLLGPEPEAGEIHEQGFGWNRKGGMV